MGLFDKIAKITKIVNELEKVGNSIENVAGDRNMTEKRDAAERTNIPQREGIVLLPTSHIVEDVEYADGDSKYSISFQLNDAFKEAKSHAAEVTMLNTYAPNEEYGEEGKMPYVAIQLDDDVYCPVEEFKQTGTFGGAMEITPLSGRFYFKAKKEYYGDIMYFYGLDRCDGFWKNNGLCIVYPKSYLGTEEEKKLMGVLDEAAASYNEVRVE